MNIPPLPIESTDHVLVIPPLKALWDGNDVLDVAVPPMFYTSPLALVALPPESSPPPRLAPRASERPWSFVLAGSGAFVTALFLATLSCILAMTANARSPGATAFEARSARAMQSFQVDRIDQRGHRPFPVAQTKYEYARTALLPPARIE